MGVCAGSKASNGNRADFTGIPQSTIDRWKYFEERGEDIDYKRLAEAWRQRKAENEKKLTAATELKVGDVIDPNRMTIKDDANIGNADEHAWWNLKKSDGTTRKEAYEAYSNFEISKIERRKDGIRVTATFDIGKQLGTKSHIATVTKVLKDTDRMRKIK